jgi:hypothetical protein
MKDYFVDPREQDVITMSAEEVKKDETTSYN